MVMGLKYRGRATQTSNNTGDDTAEGNGVTFTLVDFPDKKCVSSSHATTRYQYLLVSQRHDALSARVKEHVPSGWHRHDKPKSKAQAGCSLPFTMQLDE